MVDSLGYRMKFGVIAPSTNTSVQPEYEMMTPYGVTNHFSRAIIPDIPVMDDDDFLVLVQNIRDATESAIDSVLTCSPDHVIIGMSAETFWDGIEGSRRLKVKLEERAGMRVTLGAEACQAALKAYGDIKRIAVITPYHPIGDRNVERFFVDCGYEVVRLKGLKCTSPTLIAHVSKEELRDTVIELDGDDVDAVVQAGTNLAFAEVAAIAEFWLEKPVIAINTATYWHALRTNGIEDRLQGFGRLLSEH